MWAYNEGTKQCTQIGGSGWSESSGGCTSGWLDRKSVPADVTTQSGYRAFSGNQMNVETGAATLGDCAQLCLDTSGCKYFAWLGPIGAESFNSAGANCKLADAGASPVASSTFSGDSWGTGAC